MALVQSVLDDALKSLFSDPPPSSAQCAQAWSDAMRDYTLTIVPPSTTVLAAAAVLAVDLAASFQLPSAVATMETAFATFAASVGLGMAGFVPTPPPQPVGFATQFAGPFPVTNVDAANQLSALIHAWLTTGISTLAVAPFTVTNWS